MSPQRRVMGLIKGGEKVVPSPRVRLLVVKAFHGPLDPDEREALASYDQALGKELVNAVKKGRGKRKEPHE